MSNVMFDKLTIEKLSEVAKYGDSAEIGASNLILAYFFERFYGNKFIRICGFSPCRGIHRRHIHLSRFMTDLPRLMVCVSIFDQNRKKRMVELMLTASDVYPKHVLPSSRSGASEAMVLRKPNECSEYSLIEVMDINCPESTMYEDDVSLHMRYNFIWFIGKQIENRMNANSCFLHVWQHLIMPHIFTTSIVSHAPKITDIPLGDEKICARF